jgi:PAS domain-containing protein
MQSGEQSRQGTIGPMIFDAASDRPGLTHEAGQWAEPSRRLRGAVGRHVGRLLVDPERARPAAALAASEDRFERLMRSSGVGIVVVGPDGRTPLANRALADMLGYGEADLEPAAELIAGARTTRGSRSGRCARTAPSSGGGWSPRSAAPPMAVRAARSA